MSDQYVGEIRVFPFNFAPVGWAQCNGQILPLSQYTALFSVIGTYFGGNGTSNFALPNFQGVVPVNQGTGPGLSAYDMGETGGTPTVTLLQTEMVAHTHAVNAAKAIGTSASPDGAIYMEGRLTEGTSKKETAVFNALPPDTSLSQAAIGLVGGNLPHNNLMPYLTLNFCIALTGIFPARS